METRETICPYCNGQGWVSSSDTDDPLEPEDFIECIDCQGTSAHPCEMKPGVN